MKILQKYILKEHVSPFFICLFVVTFVLFLQQLIDLLNMIIEKQPDFQTVASILLYTIPTLLALSIPMSVLMASIMAFGRLQVDNELVAMKSGGVNPYKLLLPLFLTAFMLSGLMLYFNNDVLPNTNHRLKNLLIKIAYFKPMTNIKPEEFTTLSGYTVYVKENTGKEMRGIVIYDKESSRFPKTIVAQHGTIQLLDSGNSLQAVLYNGEMHEKDEKDPDKYSVRTFQRFHLNIKDLGNKIDFTETAYRSDRELSSKQLSSAIKDRKHEIDSLKVELATFEKRRDIAKQFAKDAFGLQEVRKNEILMRMRTDRIDDLEDTIRSYSVEYHKKYAIALACFIFVMLGVPIGMMTRTNGVGVAFSVSSFVFLVYYIALIGGEQLADKGFISPFWAMWSTNILFFLIGAYLMMISMREKTLINLDQIGQRYQLWRLKRKQK